MSSFRSLCNEVIHICHKDGRKSGPLQAAFGNNEFTVFDGTLDVTEGDLIDRPLPNGKAERYDITNASFTHKFHSIPAHVRMTVRKQGALVPFHPAKTVNIAIHNSQGFQVGDNNTQNIIESLKQVVERIESGPGTPEEKEEVKSRLKLFLEHPLTSAVLGGAAGTLTGLVG
ncbi:MAG: hypothetical protein V4819_20205 [Verrucomicrobiota bacterium]